MQLVEIKQQFNCFRSVLESIVFHYDHATEKEESYEVYLSL